MIGVRYLQHGPEDVLILGVEVVPDLTAAIERAACGAKQMSASVEDRYVGTMYGYNKRKRSCDRGKLFLFFPL